MASERAPFCDDGCQGYSNALYRVTGDLRDQWLARCGRPAKAIFMSTNRWDLERDLWLLRQRL